MDLKRISTGTRRKSFGFFRNITAFLIVLIVAGNALAALPDGAEIMKKNLKALGGEAAFARHHNCLMKGKMSISGIEMDVTIYLSEPNLKYVRFESAMIGKMESGCNGEAAWDLSVMQGASVKEGKELEKELFNSVFNSELLWKDRYTSIDVLGEEEIDGTACYKLVLTPAVGNTVTTYIDKETWLTVKTETVDESPTGSVTIVSNLSDYREVDGVKLPFKTKLVLMGAQQMTTTLDSVEFNVEIPEGVFELPAEIQELLAAEKDTEGN